MMVLVLMGDHLLSVLVSLRYLVTSHFYVRYCVLNFLLLLLPLLLLLLPSLLLLLPSSLLLLPSSLLLWLL